MTGPPIRVNSWNPWDPLRRVIVGRAEGTMVQAPEPAIRREWPDHGFPLGSYGPIPQDMTAAATEQLDNLASLLRRRGIQVDRPEPLDLGRTALFDAADIAPVGKDLFVQLSLVTNRAGYRWLRQHFPGHRVHAVTFDATAPMHIDATWVPLRPGLVLHCAERAADPDLLGYFKANDWQVIPAAPPQRGRDQLPPLSFCSPWLSMNILSLDATTICVEATETATADQLSKLGFEVIPVPFWDVASFGGGLHCATADIERDGGLEDYFPTRHARF